MRWGLKKLMYDKGITQDQLAKAAGVTGGYVSYVVKGLRNPSLDVSRCMADALGLTLDDFVALLDISIHAPSQGRHKNRMKEINQ